MVNLVASISRVRSEQEIILRIADRGTALVALSGGVDSSVVATLAFEALGPRSVALTLAGPAVARSEVERACRVARTIGIEHAVVDVNPLARAEYRANTPNRCYFCRSVETEVLRREGRARGIEQYLDGVQVDDLSEDRPGLRAMDEAGFDHPLVWAGWSKTMVRASARARDLPNWDQPSDACLSSRVAHGDPVSAELLQRIELGEAWIAGRGFRRVRVRTRGRGARIEVDPDDVPRLSAEPLATEVRRALGNLGFAPVEIDPVGYGQSRTGRHRPA
ncbi:MAG: ATP-dependent sacrificial sulfur transferase LarE [Thermoplasmata archaeon]|nr:ATP-dependent sacrificial sulfur transferase LarE [Thermoplasmata archaeon]